MLRYSAGDHSLRASADERDLAEVAHLKTAFNELAATIEASLQQLRRVDEERSEVAATLTHELRTPLTSIRGYAQLIRDGDAGEVSSEQKGFLDQVVQGCDRMRALIDRVLELEKKENEAAWVDPSRLGQVNLVVPIQECFEIVKPLAREKNLQLSFELPESFSVWGDAERLRQVFLNLISNAVKYNKRDGKVIVRGSPLADARVRIDVEDTGIGLSEVERKKLFQKYYRTQDADRTSVTGSGLGLYLSRRWIESLGGTISVESEPGIGSCFRVELPVRRESGRCSGD